MSLTLLGIPFKRVWNSSGTRGFFGEGYWYHPWLKPFGLDFKDATFQSKTTTLHANKGNMPLDDQYRPIERKPKCIHVNFLGGYALNAVGLSGPGLEALLATGKWQSRTEPFAISFMSIADNLADRQRELEIAIQLLCRAKKEFQAPFAFIQNYSCPNVDIDLDPRKVVQESKTMLDLSRPLRALGSPIGIKINLTISVPIAANMALHPACDVVCIGNTIPFGAIPDQIDWNALFPTGVSPLLKTIGKPGGLSGRPLNKPTKIWMQSAKEYNFPKPRIACGGIFSAPDARDMFDLGASAVEIGSVVFHRPDQVKSIANLA